MMILNDDELVAALQAATAELERRNYLLEQMIKQWELWLAYIRTFEEIPRK